MNRGTLFSYLRPSIDDLNLILKILARETLSKISFMSLIEIGDLLHMGHSISGLKSVSEDIAASLICDLMQPLQAALQLQRDS